MAKAPRWFKATCLDWESGLGGCPGYATQAPE
jgi:hypothetical protein